jgi:metal-responsive CopG/Arc/MetJ family transcriptional regulator
MKVHTKTLQVRVPEPLVEEIEKETERTGNGRSTVVRLALLKYFEKSEGQP